REDDALARAGGAPRGRGRGGDRPRPRSARRRDGAQGARRLRPAGLQPPPRSHGGGEPALHGAHPPRGRGRVPRARRRAARAAGPLQVDRAWGDARAIARAARALPYVEGAWATGRFVRIEVRRGEAPGAARLLADLAALAGGAVSFTEETPLDMESTLRALS